MLRLSFIDANGWAAYLQHAWPKSSRLYTPPRQCIVYRDCADCGCELSEGRSSRPGGSVTWFAIKRVFVVDLDGAARCLSCYQRRQQRER